MAETPRRRKHIRETTWYPYAMAGCIVVAAYVLLTHLTGAWYLIWQFVGFFTPVIYGCVIAYIVNPLGKLFERKLFKNVKKDSARWIFSSFLAFALIACFAVLALAIVVPQLVDSIVTFAGNLDDYAASLTLLVSNVIGVEAVSLQNASQDIIQNATTDLHENIDTILDIGISTGKGIVTWGIAIILSVYLLMEKNKLKAGTQRFMRACFSQTRYDAIMEFLRRSDVICNRYIVFNLIDSLIIGIICGIVMTIVGMPYVGLVAFVVAVTNLIPTFGPVIGGVIGAFILLMVNPVQAVIFVVVVVVLQFFDGYILKPRLFGNSLGVSGLSILIAVIVCGSMFGIAGMLIAIPATAIFDFSYSDYLLPWLERKRKAKDAEREGVDVSPATEPPTARAPEE